MLVCKTRPVAVLFTLSAALACAAVSGCSKPDVGVKPGARPTRPATGAGPGSAAASAYKSVEVANGATLRGTIRYTGTPPQRIAVTVGSDKETCGLHEILPEELIVSSDGGVRNAVVWLEGVKEGKPWSQQEVTQDQVKCVFTPHVVAVGVKQNIKFANSDPVVHNVRTFPRENQPLNLSLLAKGLGKPSVKSFALPDEMKVACDSHKWMSAWIIVRDNPYFAVTGDDGSYEIGGVPPGKYKVVYWHESLEKVETHLELAAGQTLTNDLELKDR